MRSSLVRMLLFGAAALVCIYIAMDGVGRLSGGYTAKGVLYLAAGVMLGIPVALGYYYYKGRYGAGAIEYDALLSPKGANGHALQGKPAKITQKEGDNNASDATSNQN